MLGGGCAPLEVIPLPQGLSLGCLRVDLDVTALSSRHRHSCECTTQMCSQHNDVLKCTPVCHPKSTVRQKVRISTFDSLEQPCTKSDRQLNRNPCEDPAAVAEAFILPCEAPTDHAKSNSKLSKHRNQSLQEHIHAHKHRGVC